MTISYAQKSFKAEMTSNHLSNQSKKHQEIKKALRRQSYSPKKRQNQHL